MENSVHHKKDEARMVPNTHIPSLGSQKLLWESGTSSHRSVHVILIIISTFSALNVPILQMRKTRPSSVVTFSGPHSWQGEGHTTSRLLLSAFITHWPLHAQSQSCPPSGYSMVSLHTCALPDIISTWSTGCCVPHHLSPRFGPIGWSALIKTGSS